MKDNKKPHFLNFSPLLAENYMITNGQKKFRTKQLLDWVYKKRINSFDDCSDLSAEFREKLKNDFTLYTFEIKDKKVSALDGSIRYYFSTAHGDEVITVFMPNPERNTICLSSQVGCPVKCTFCASGSVDFKRNLTRGEILEQLLQVERDTKLSTDSVLFMGMGEPLMNYENVVNAVHSLTSPEQFAYGRRKIVISTAGLVPQIEKLSQENISVKLALSLHGADDETRRKIVPSIIPYKVEDILQAGLNYGRQTKSSVTIEYVLIEGINDDLQQAEKLADLIQEYLYRTDRLKINIIPHNPTGVDRFKRPSDEKIQSFKDCFMRRDLTAIIRESKGTDIGAACGQLTI